MNKLYFFIILLVVGFMHLSCEKQNEIAPTREEFLTGGGNGGMKEWILDKIYEDGIDITKTLTDCQRDNTLVFYENKDYRETEGANICPGNPPISMDSTFWSFSRYKQNIYIGKDKNHEYDSNPNDPLLLKTYNIDELLENKLEITYKSGLKTYKETYIPK